MRAPVVLVLFACGRVDFEPAFRAGCADGTREAFGDETAFPDLAGCAASWSGTIDMRGPTAAALCDIGWHICGLAGDPTELSARATVADCMSAGGLGSGAWVTAMQHCSGENGGCQYALPLGCPMIDANCTESVCCGPACNALNSCKDGVYPGMTSVDPGLHGCGVMPSSTISGVLCCR